MVGYLVEKQRAVDLGQRGITIMATFTLKGGQFIRIPIKHHATYHLLLRIRISLSVCQVVSAAAMVEDQLLRHLNQLLPSLNQLPTPKRLLPPVP